MFEGLGILSMFLFHHVGSEFHFSRGIGQGGEIAESSKGICESPNVIGGFFVVGINFRVNCVHARTGISFEESEILL
jgi:hypothetical protein